jgi:hypothetical protein
MTEDEARDLLPMYVDGLLRPEQAREVEAVLAKAPALQTEYKRLKEENLEVQNMLNEALAPLRPSRSARMRLSDAMLDVHRRAEHVANTMPERGWRIFRFGLLVVTLLAAVVALKWFPRAPKLNDEGNMLNYITIGLFINGIIFLLSGRFLADLESRLMNRISKRYTEPSRLEILTLEVFGILSILASAALYIYQG